MIIVYNPTDEQLNMWGDYVFNGMTGIIVKQIDANTANINVFLNDLNGSIVNIQNVSKGTDKGNWNTI